MRKNIFLHFLNRDSRQIYGLFRDISDVQHRRALSQAVKVCVILCEEYCVTPPQFVIECPIARDCVRGQSVFLVNQLIRYSMRESSVGDLVEKKRREYAPYRQQYSGLYDDNNVAFLLEKSSGFLGREAEMGKGIAERWLEGPDRRHSIWMPVNNLLTTQDLATVRMIPARLIDSGFAATWPAIRDQLPSYLHKADRVLRRVLQHEYFRLYIEAYGLSVIRGLPLMIDDFGLPVANMAYNYPYFIGALTSLSLRDLILAASPESIVELRSNYGFVKFLDFYSFLCCGAANGERGEVRLSDVQSALSRAARKTRFAWAKFAAGRGTAFSELVGTESVTLSPGEITELGDAMASLVDEGEKEIGMPETVQARQKVSTSYIGRQSDQKITIFVALEFEMNVLIRRWNLKRGSLQGPQATGEVNGTPIDIICALGMGRVRAAVEVMNYLHYSGKPALIIVTGLAGGFETEGISRGHILIADSVVDLATRKIRDQEAGGISTEFRRHDYTLTDVFHRLMRSAHFDRDAWERRAIGEADWPEGLRPAIHYGPVTSLDEVVSSEEWQRSLAAAAPKLLGVEMEAGGVCAAAEAFSVPVAVLRTVSDLADPSKKDDDWRRKAMITVATLLEAIEFREVLQYLRNRRH